MTDYSELKRLAEAATQGDWRTGEWMPKETIGRHQVVVDSEIGPYVILGGNQNFIEDAKNNAAFVASANPAAVLALIAENERIKARLCACRDCAGQGEVYSGHDSYQGHFQPPEPDMDVCGTCGGDGVLGPLEDFEVLAAERDQLKAENEALRHDAELYRFVSQLAWYVDRAAQVYDIGNQSAQWSDERQAVDADEVQAAICAVMSQGEQL